MAITALHADLIDDDADHIAAGPYDVVVEAPGRDIREIAADEPAPVYEDTVRIPTPDETADDYADATRALAEINARRAIDLQEETEHRAAELDRWHADDQATADVEDHTDEVGGYDEAMPR